LEEAQYVQPTWKQTIAALFRDIPASVTDLHALVVDHFREIKERILFTNTDIYKRFWNEDSRGRIDHPKPEESCRDVLVDLLRQRLALLGIVVEPEGHMVSDKRSDIAVFLAEKKIVVELKRDYHVEVWTAAENQLDRFYTRDPEASGYGIYAVFWFGPKRRGNIPKPPNGVSLPQNAEEMESALRSALPLEKANKIAVLVIDVSGPAS
jgi:hypothetical protein